jgi:hypothetical protein
VRRGRKAAGLSKDEKIAGLPDKGNPAFFSEILQCSDGIKLENCPIFDEAPEISRIPVGTQTHRLYPIEVFGRGLPYLSP